MSHEEKKYEEIRRKVKASIVDGTELKEPEKVDPFQQKLEKYGIKEEVQKDPIEKKLEKYQ